MPAASEVIVGSCGIFTAGNQTAYLGFQHDGRLRTKGQLGAYFYYNKGLGVGNSMGINGLNECWGGSSYGAGNAEP